jgi:hypothetical protein
MTSAWPPRAGCRNARSMGRNRQTKRRNRPLSGGRRPGDADRVRRIPLRSPDDPRFGAHRPRSTPIARWTGERFSSTGFSHTGAVPSGGTHRKDSRAAPPSEKACTLSWGRFGHPGEEPEPEVSVEQVIGYGLRISSKRFSCDFENYQTGFFEGYLARVRRFSRSDPASHPGSCSSKELSVRRMRKRTAATFPTAYHGGELPIGDVSPHPGLGRTN